MNTTSLYSRYGKRLFDIAAAGTGLILLSPVFVIVALAIKLTSPGPVLFGQVRVGQNFKPFVMYKFRSMTVAQPGQASLLTVKNDARITPIGRWLRKTKCDELPQLWNVFIGQMSLVGPRPEVDKHVQWYREDYSDILKIKPGITDYAAKTFRNEEAILAKYTDVEHGYKTEVLPEKIKLYRQYGRELSLKTDLHLILTTVFGKD